MNPHGDHIHQNSKGAEMTPEKQTKPPINDSKSKGDSQEAIERSKLIFGNQENPPIVTTNSTNSSQKK